MLLYRKAILALSLIVATVSLYGVNLNEAQYNKLTKEYTLNADGSYSLRVVKELTLFTHSSFNKLYGETFVIYNPQRESLTINECRTTQADGTVITAPDNAFNEVLPSSAANAPAYNHIKEMVITHTGLEIGASIYLDYTLTSQPAEDGATPFDIKEVIQESSPVKEYTISIEAPKELALRYKLIGASTKPKVVGDKLIFKFKNVAPAAVEQFKPQNGVAPMLLATTASEDFAASKFAKSITCSSIDELVSEITAGKEGSEILSSILSYINSRIDSSALPFIYQNNQERSPEVVIKSGYATKYEKDMILKAMLAVAQIPYETILIYPSGISLDMLTLSTLKGVLFKIDESYYSSASTKAIEIGRRSGLDSFYLIAADGSVSIIVAPELAPITNSYSQKISEKMALESGYIIFTPKSIDSGVRSWGLRSLPTQRTSPLELVSTISECSTWTIELEEGVKLQSEEFEKSISYPFGELSITLVDQGDSVILTRSISITKQTITPSEYSKFREFINAWNSSKGAQLLFVAE
ncbi:MAG: DUF3857 domain-containing protein [Rikenellaceae bacterium]